MQWIIPVATAAWAIWTWAHDHERERQRERIRMAALYVSPFLSACEELQSRIFKLLELDGLETLRQRYPDGGYAEETLYLVVRFFGWSVAVSRYGPYTQDAEVIRLSTACRRAFSTSGPDRPVGAFNFFIPEQKALGKMVMHSLEGEFGRELDTISFYEFRERLASPPLSDSASVKDTLEALRTAKSAGDLPGRERLAEAQSYLVDLLIYLEGQERYSLFAGERKKCAGYQEQAAIEGFKPEPARVPRAAIQA
jgi:hypothetical protein